MTNGFISLQGLQDSPEYQATKEWQDFLHSYDTDGAILAEIGNQPTGFEDVSLFYQVYTQEMYDKLVEIADKYGLMLHSELNVVSVEELNYRVGGSFTGEEIAQGWGYIYENGTFQFDGEALIDDKIVHIQFGRSVKGTLEETVLNIGRVDEYQEIQYETLGGETVLLALGMDHSLIYVDYEECFILMNALAGTEEGFLDDKESAITMEDLKRMADGIDFSMLSNVIKPDMRGDSKVETNQGNNDENIEIVSDSEFEVTQESETDTDKLYDGVETDRLLAYRNVLEEIYYHQQFPGGRELGYDGFDMSDNRFAIKDIDGDGNEELIIFYITTYMAGQAEIIYDYDAATGSVREQFIHFPSVTHFENGILKADWSHNQGVAGRIWPYTLYQYNPEKDIYEAIAMVDAWDKSFADTDYEGNAFPDDVDKDGDLLIYYIMPPDEYKLKDPVDFDEYEKWFDSYTKDARIVTLSYTELTEDNISMLE